jgi:hypothetical protein
MEFGTAVMGAFLFLLLGLFVWFCISCLKFFYKILTTPMGSSSAAEYPDGPDEPDGSSYSVVNGQVRLD